MPPQNAYVEALTPNATVFGDRAFKEVIRLNEVIGVGAESNMISDHIRRDRHQGHIQEGPCEDTAVCKPRKERPREKTDLLAP